VSTLPRELTCCDCGRDWTLRVATRRAIDVRCPLCRTIHERRVALRAEVDEIVVTERGNRLAIAALAAARHAGTLSPGSAGPSPLADAVHAMTRSGRSDEHVRENLLVRVAAAAILWASEIAGALNG
jgi:hypothetical protein